MNSLRTFIALEIPPRIQQEISIQTAALRKTLGPGLVRWVPANNVHLTLKFLGNVSPANIEALSNALALLAGDYETGEMDISGLGTFPNTRRPRVIWVGIQAPPMVGALQHKLETVTAKLGYPTENRPFHPHLTIGRVKNNISPAGLQTLKTALEHTKIAKIGTAPVKAIHLFKSELKPAGAVYTELYSAPFKEIQTRGEI